MSTLSKLLDAEKQMFDIKSIETIPIDRVRIDIERANVKLFVEGGLTVQSKIIINDHEIPVISFYIESFENDSVYLSIVVTTNTYKELFAGYLL